MRRERRDPWLETIRARFIPESSTAEEMSYVDENSKAIGIPVQSLMENAGAGVAAVVEEEFGAKGKRILIVAGTGNKGGDGFVACRHLLNRGARVSLILLGGKNDIHTAEARANWQVLERLDSGLKLSSVKDSADLGALRAELKGTDLVIDAMLGTGARGDLREPFASSVTMLNGSGKPIVSIDTPTGLDPSTGEVQGTSVRPKLTVTLHKSKSGFRRNGRLTGRVRVVEIGIPLEAELFSGPGDVRRVTSPRKSSSSKRDHGYVLIVGGSDIYSGAPGLTALAALRTGAGLSIVAAPEKVCDTIRSFSPDLIVHPLPGPFLEPRHVEYIAENKLLERVNAVVVGPGLGSHDESGDAVRALVQAIKNMKLPFVLDADAIRAFVGELGQIDGGAAVLTPNAGEFKAIAHVEVGENWTERVEPAVGVAKEAGCTVLLKGHNTVITNGEQLRINRSGNPGMAVGGTGDVLSGVISAYLAQRNAPFWSAVAGAYIHGRAGDLACEERGFHILASDLIEKLPPVLKPFDRLA